MNPLEYESVSQRADRLWRICQACARSIYGSREPTERYANLTARLLLGTAAQESGFEWERQRTPAFFGDIGGFTKWQIEAGSFNDSLNMLRGRPELASRATQWLFADLHASTAWLFGSTPESLFWGLRLDDNDKVGALFCRLHYARDPHPIADSLGDQARYWKRIYNTLAGKGTSAQYVLSWNRLCKQIAGEWPI